MRVTILHLLAIFAKEGFCFNTTQYSQKDYVLESERFEELSHNDEYMGRLNMKNFKCNRTSFALNFTFIVKKELNNAFGVEMQAYKFASNEYRLFPMAFPFNVCEALSKDVFGVSNMYNCGNMFRCPIKKGTYLICNWLPDYTKFPPYLPRGRYMLDIKGKYFKIDLFRFQWYMAIKDVQLIY